MNSIQFIQYTPEQFQAEIVSGVQNALSVFFKQYPLNSDDDILTRQDVADLFRVNLSTIHNWCKQGKLKPYGIGNRVYFRRAEVEGALIRIF